MDQRRSCLQHFSGRTKCLDQLVEKGCDLNAVDKFKDTILHWACFGGYVYMIKHVQSRANMSLDVTRPDGFTLLMAATWNGNIHAFDFLVSRGCEVKVTDNEGNNVLH